MPAFNAELYIENALESLANQTLDDYEVIAIDDASTDNTAYVIEQYSSRDRRIRLLRNSVNQGYLRTWNAAIAKADGNFITFLDADDTCHPRRLELLQGLLESRKDCDLCGSAIYLLNSAGTAIGGRSYPTNWDEIRSRLLEAERFPFCGSAVMIRRIVYEQIGGYRDFFDRVGWEDHDWLIRCCERFKALNLQDALYGYRDHDRSVTRSIAPSEMRKLVIRRIGIDLAQQRAREGADCLMTGNMKELGQLIERHERPYRQDPSRIFRILGARAMARCEWEEWWAHTKAAFRRRPCEPRNLKLALVGGWRALYARLRHGHQHWSANWRETDQ